MTSPQMLGCHQENENAGFFSLFLQKLPSSKLATCTPNGLRTDHLSCSFVLCDTVFFPVLIQFYHFTSQSQREAQKTFWCLDHHGGKALFFIGYNIPSWSYFSPEIWGTKRRKETTNQKPLKTFGCFLYYTASKTSRSKKGGSSKKANFPAYCFSGQKQSSRPIWKVVERKRATRNPQKQRIKVLMKGISF